MKRNPQTEQPKRVMLLWSRIVQWSKRSLCALFPVALLASAPQVFCQHAKNNPANLAVQVTPAVQLTTNGSTNVSLWIRLANGSTGTLWGDSTSACNEPIANATAYSSSGEYNNILLSSIPFTTSNNYVCAYNAGAAQPSAYVVWPHTVSTLKFGTQPGNGTADSAISPAVTVQVLDTNGILDTASTAPVTISITTGTGTSGATLSGTLTRSAVNGVATFNDLAIRKVGTGYKLTASSNSLASATSNPFNIAPGAATQLAFTTQPGGGTAGVVWATQPVVTVEDAYGNTVTTSTASVALAIATNPGGGTLACATNPQTASAGIAAFTGCKMSPGGTGYTLQATASGLSSAISGKFNVQDFTLSANPNPLSVRHNVASGSSTVSLTNLGGFSGTVALTCTVASSGANNPLTCSGKNPSVTLSPSSIAGSGTSTLSIIAQNVSQSTYTVTVTGTSGAVSRSMTILVTIN